MPSTTSTTDIDLGLDILANAPLDDEEVQRGRADEKKAAEDALLPSGVYLTDPENTTIRFDTTQEGRARGNIFGLVTNGNKSGYVGTKFSWIRQNRVLKDGTPTDAPDFLYSRYMDLYDAFEQMFGRKPKNAQEFVDLVAAGSLQYKVRKTKASADFDAGNLVGKITVPKESA